MGWDPQTGQWDDSAPDAGISAGGGIAEQTAAPVAAGPPVIQIPDAAVEPITPSIAPAAAPTPAIPTPQPMTPTEVGHRTELSPASRSNLGEIDANTTARRATAEAGGQAGIDRAQKAAADAQAVQDERGRQQAEFDNAQQLHQKNIAALQARSDAEYQKSKAMGLHDPEADKSFGQRLLTALAIGLGQYSAAMNHTTNQAAEIVGQATKDNYARQRAAIEQQKENAIRAGQDVQEAVAAAAQKNHDLLSKQAGQIAAFKDRFATESARLGIPEARIAASKTVLDLDKQALEARQKILASTDTVVRQQTARELRGRATGAGGGSGPGVSSAAAELVKRMETAKAAGSPMSQGDLITAANELHIPLDAKGGHTSLKTILAQATTNAGTGLRDERQLSKETAQWAAENGVTKIATQQRELGAVLEEVQNAPHNPLQQALAIEKAVSSARGGAASKQALALALGHLGGKWDSIEAVIQGARDGEISQKQMDNFVGFMRNQLGTAQGEGKTAYDNFNKYIESQPAERRKALEQERSRVFSGLHGFQGSGETKAPAGAPATDKRARVQAALDKPGLSAEDKAKLTLWLRENK